MSVDAWNRHAKLYERSFERASWYWAHNALTLAGFVGPLESPKTLLDIACGPGRFAVMAAQHGFEVTAIDCAENMVQYTRERAIQAHVDIAAMVGDGEHLYGLEDEFFDVVTSHFGVVTLPDHEGAWKAMHRVLKPGGKLMMSSWSFEGGFPIALAVYAEIHAENRFDKNVKENPEEAAKDNASPDWNSDEPFKKKQADRVAFTNLLKEDMETHGFINGAVYTVHHDACFANGKECVDLLLDNVMTPITLPHKDVRSVKLCMAHYLELVSQGIDPMTDHQAPPPPKLADGVKAEEMQIWSKPVVVPGCALISIADKPL